MRYPLSHCGLWLHIWQNEIFWMRYRLIVWDFDGTLADTMSLALTTYNELARLYGFRRVEDPARARGLGTMAFLREHGISVWRLPLLVKGYLAATKSRMPSIRLFDGVAGLLTGLKAHGSRLGVLSSNSADNIRTCLAANGVEGVFDFIVGYPRLFGKATALSRILKREGLEPAHLLYIGDGERDVQAAREVGVDSAAVAWGFHGVELLSKQNPTYLWSSPSEVLPALGSALGASGA